MSNTTNPQPRMVPKGTIAIEEAVLNPSGVSWMAETASLFSPPSSASSSGTGNPLQHLHGHTTQLLDIHGEHLKQMDNHGVEYMLLSLTSPGPQGQPCPGKVHALAVEANDWLAAEVAKNTARFGALASVSMHNAQEAAGEVRRCVKKLGMYGVIINDYQEVQVAVEGGAEEDGKGKGYGKKWCDTPEYRPFWKEVEELGVPIYLHPRYPSNWELQTHGSGTADRVGEKDGKGEEAGGDGNLKGETGEKEGWWAQRKHLLGAAVQFHLDLSKHLYAICSSGVFDEFPGVQVVVGHLASPSTSWRADHWYNKPVKKASRLSKHDYGYYFKHNISITTSGFFSTSGLKFCIDQIGVERCLFSIDYPYDTIEEAQTWWKGVDLPEKEKKMVARENAIRLFRLPLEL